MISSPHLLGDFKEVSENYGELGAQRGLRLSDAEQIATGRLEGASHGSLREALATRSALEQPAGRLADRIESVREDFSRSPVSYVDAVQANGTALFGWPEPMPPAHAIEMPGPGMQPDLFDYREQLSPETVDLATAELAETVRQGFAGAAHQIWPEHGLAPSYPPPDPALVEAVQPLVSAYEATARLAADASAASDALENLKQLLTMRLAESQAGAPLQHEMPIPAPVAPQVSLPSMPPPLPPTHYAASAPPAQQDQPPSARPVPFQAAPAPETFRARSETASEPDAFPVMPLPPQPPPAMPVELAPPPAKTEKLPVGIRPTRKQGRQQLDVRGFFAGFALSWAVGVVLYFYMTAG